LGLNLVTLLGEMGGEAEWKEVLRFRGLSELARFPLILAGSLGVFPLWLRFLGGMVGKGV
jgi:hypothetical protein